MKIKISEFLFIFGIMIMAGCGIPSEFIRTKYIPGKKEGMIVGTINIINRPLIGRPKSYILEFGKDSNITRLIDGDKATWTKPRDMNGRYTISIEKYKADFKDQKDLIFLFNIVKPEGSYKFFKLTLFYDSGLMKTYKHSWIDVPFDIVEGQTAYLGEIKINHKEGSFLLNDKIERDRTYFQERFPTIKF